MDMETVTDVVPEAARSPRLFHSPRGLYPYQQDGIAQAYLSGAVAMVFDVGLGKGVAAIATAAMLFEDDAIDYCLVVCERNKVIDWIREFARFTDLEPALRYHDLSPAKRRELREAGLAPVIVSTYETMRADLAKWGPNRRKDPEPGPLAVTLAGKRILLVLDEATKVRSRTSLAHRAFAWTVNKWLRRRGECKVLALTATPIESGVEDFYNIVRIIDPDLAGTVASFEANYVLARDEYGAVVRYCNLDDDDPIRDPGVPTFHDKVSPILLRKRKTDPDVRELFPTPIEEFVSRPLESKHAAFYREVAKAFGDEDDLGAQLFTVLRQIAAHPMSLTRSQGGIQQALVAEVGHAGLEAIPASKADWLVEHLAPVVAQGDQALCFSFFGPSVIPLLAERLAEEGISCAQHYGAQSNSQNQAALDDFAERRVSVLLSSDAGSRGVNLPGASHLIQFELPFLTSTYAQRMGRASRVGAGGDVVVNVGFIAEGTVEHGVPKVLWRRGEQSDRVLGDLGAEGHLTAEARHRLMIWSDDG